MNKMSKLNLPDANISYACEILEFLFIFERRDHFNTEKEVIEYFNKTPAYTKSAINFLMFFDIVHVKDQLIKIKKEVFKKIDGTKQKSLLVIKEKIVKFKPYVEYYYFLSVGKKKDESSRLIKKIYFIKQEHNKINKIFKEWSKLLDIKHEFKPTVASRELDSLNKSLNDELLINQFLREQFGDHYKSINADLIEDLAEALKDYKKDSRKSINDAGRALEDFLRLDFVKSINLTKCAGIIQISNILNNNSMSTKKHNGVLFGLGNIRSMGDAHGIDSKEGERWSIRDNSALLYILIVIKTMISLLEYKKGNLIF